MAIVETRVVAITVIKEVATKEVATSSSFYTV